MHDDAFVETRCDETPSGLNDGPSCTRHRYVDVHHIQEQAHGGEHSRHNCLVLCDNHHTKLHAGELVLSGDAEGRVEFRDASGQPIESSLPPAAADRAIREPGAVTRAGSSASGGGASGEPGAVTRAGSSASGGGASGEPGAATRAGSSASGGGASGEPGAATRAGALLDVSLEQIELRGRDPKCARVLALIGNRGGWTVDSLVEATGLSVPIVQQTRCILELQGMGSAFAV